MQHQLSAPFLKFRDGQFKPYKAKCSWIKNSLKIQCQLLPGQFWSDGSALTMTDYLRTVLRFLDPKAQSPKADLFFPIKNALMIYQKSISVEQLGIKIEKDKMLITLETPQADFMHTLTLSQWTPTHPKDVGYEYNQNWAGDFEVKYWNHGKSIMLKRQRFAPTKDNLEIEFKIINDDSLAIQMYQIGDLDFVRRVPTPFIPKLEGRSDFYKFDQIKFDFLAFSPQITDIVVKKIIAQNLKFSELQKIYSAKSPPGCSGLPTSWSGQTPCIQTISDTLEQQEKKNPEAFRKLRSQKWSYSFSLLGGLDHQVSAEWFQLQGKKNLRLEFEIHPMEDRIFIQKIKTQTALVFRRGFSPDLPSCYQVLKEFLPDGRESYLKVPAVSLNKWVRSLKASADPQACFLGQNYLMNQMGFIPTGAIYFSILASKSWKGWFLSPSNELDLSGLQKIN